MTFRNTGSAALSIASMIILFTLFFPWGLLEAKTDSKNSTATTSVPEKKWASIDGFRSAKFGMDENKVKKAIAKDFKISSRKIKKSIHPIEKTVNLTVSVPKLFQAGGASRVAYVFGHQSKKLIQVNVVWGLAGGTKDVDGQGVVDAANILRSHFVKKRYKGDGSLVVNAKVSETKIMVFRGTDQKGRMAILVLDTPKPLKDESPKDAAKKVSLTLSYILKPNEPDILTIEEGMF
jgi:hypothetical protein